MNWKASGRTQLWPNFGCYPGTCLEELGKTAITCQFIDLRAVISIQGFRNRSKHAAHWTETIRTARSTFGVRSARNHGKTHLLNISGVQSGGLRNALLSRVSLLLNSRVFTGEDAWVNFHDCFRFPTHLTPKVNSNTKQNQLTNHPLEFLLLT